MVYNCSMVIDRIKSEMRKSGLNARELAERASVGKSFVYDILSGKSSNPTSKKLASIAKVLEIPVSQLISGDITTKDFGKMTPILPIHNPADARSSCHEPTLYVPINNKLNINTINLRYYVMEGDSMEPTLCNADFLLVDIGNMVPHPGGLFAIVDEIGVSIKRLECVLNEHRETRLHVISDNSKYSSYYCDKGDVSIIGRVVRYCRTV